MTGCAIFGCKSYHSGQTVTRYRLPTDPVVASQWIEVIKRSRGDLPWKDNKRIFCLYVCSDHFAYKDMCRVGNKRRPIKGAVPTRIHVTEEDVERDRIERERERVQTEREIAIANVVKLEPVDPEHNDPLLAIVNIAGENVQENVDNLVTENIDDLVSKKHVDDSAEVKKLQKALKTSKQINRKQRQANKLLHGRAQRLQKNYNALKRLTKGLVNILKQLKQNEGHLDSGR